MSEASDLEIQEWVIRRWFDGYGGEIRLAEDEYGELVLEGRYSGSAAEILRLLAEIVKEVIDHADL